MTIEISEDDFRQIEDALTDIRQLVMTARMSDNGERNRCLKDIMAGTNRIANLLLNGELVDSTDIEEEVEARR